MARAVLLILFCLLLPLLFECDTRKLLRVSDRLCNASATATHEESMNKEECEGIEMSCSSGAGKLMVAHTDYIYTQDLDP